MIIGLTGRAGAGKDYTFKWLDERDYPVTRLAWADNLKKEIEDVLNYGQRLDALWDKPYPPEVRKLLQWWGTDLRRGQDPEYWVKKMKAELAPYAAGGPLTDRVAVVTDVRFPNEAVAIREMGGIIIRVWAPKTVRKERLGVLPPEHASETGMDAIDPNITLWSQNNRLQGATDEDAAKWRGLLQNIGL